MVKRRYLPRRSKRLHKQPCRLHGHSTWRFSGSSGRPTSPPPRVKSFHGRIQTRVAVHGNPLACTRLARSISSIHHSPSMRPPTGDEIKLQPVIEPVINLLLSCDARTVDVCLREKERERERNSYNVTLHVARNLPFNLENSDTDFIFSVER